MDETLMFIDYLLRCLEEVEKVMQERSKEKKTTFQGEKKHKEMEGMYQNRWTISIRYIKVTITIHKWVTLTCSKNWANH